MTHGEATKWAEQAIRDGACHPGKSPPLDQELVSAVAATIRERVDEAVRSQRIQMARETMRREFHDDPDFLRTYADNVACVLFDHAGSVFGGSPFLRNRVARVILGRIFADYDAAFLSDDAPETCSSPPREGSSSGACPPGECADRRTTAVPESPPHRQTDDPNRPIAVGDVVTLRHGGPEMTVGGMNRLNGEVVSATCYVTGCDESGSVQDSIILVGALHRVR